MKSSPAFLALSLATAALLGAAPAVATGGFGTPDLAADAAVSTLGSGWNLKGWAENSGTLYLTNLTVDLTNLSEDMSNNENRRDNITANATRGATDAYGVANATVANRTAYAPRVVSAAFVDSKNASDYVNENLTAFNDGATAFAEATRDESWQLALTVYRGQRHQINITHTQTANATNQGFTTLRNETVTPWLGPSGYLCHHYGNADRVAYGALPDCAAPTADDLSIPYGRLLRETPPGVLPDLPDSPAEFIPSDD